MSRPKKFCVYYSTKRNHKTLIVCAIMMLFGGTGLLFGEVGYVIAGLFFLFALRFGIPAVLQLLYKAPILILSPEGMSAKNMPFKNWDEFIEITPVFAKYGSKTSAMRFVYLKNEVEYEYRIDTIYTDLKIEDLENAILKYRGWHNSHTGQRAPRA
jgi:hypothetical protein